MTSIASPSGLVARGGYRGDIDGLRAVAIVPVLFFHAGLWPFEGGFVGVDVFFVISGFLITSLILPEVRDGTFSIRNFYERRVRRIFPALFACLAVVTAASIAVLLPSDLRSFARSLVAVTFFVSNLHFYSESGYFAAASDEQPLLHTWSLAVEEQYYILFPLFLVAVQRFQRGRFRSWTGLVVFASLGLCAIATTTHPVASFYLAPTRAWEIGLGSLLAMGVVPGTASHVTRNLAAVIGAGLIAFAVVGFSSATAFPGVAALVPCVGAGLIIWAGTGGDNSVGRLLRARPVVAIGLVSYSLYLWHWPLLVLAGYWHMRRLTPTEALLILALSVAAAFLSWRYVERPFRGRNGMMRRRQLFASAAGVMALTAALGVAAAVSGGFYGRLDDRSRALLAGAEDRPPADWKCASVDPIAVGRRGLCRIGATATAASTFLLWGDSHAYSVAHAVGDVAARNGVAGYMATYAACAPLVGVVREDKAGAPECVDFNDAVLEFAQSDPVLTDVILVARWGLYAQGSRYKNEAGVDVRLRDEQSRESSARENVRVLERSLERTIAALRASGKTVWLVAPIPEVGWNVPSVLARARLRGRNLDIAPTLDEYEARQGRVLRELEELQVAGGVRILYPHEVLCDQRQCAVEHRGRALYFDEHHLSLTGARHIERIFDDVFSSARVLFSRGPGEPRQPVR